MRSKSATPATNPRGKKCLVSPNCIPRSGWMWSRARTRRCTTWSITSSLKTFMICNAPKTTPCSGSQIGACPNSSSWPWRSRTNPALCGVNTLRLITVSVWWVTTNLARRAGGSCSRTRLVTSWDCGRGLWRRGQVRGMETSSRLFSRRGIYRKWIYRVCLKSIMGNLSLFAKPRPTWPKTTRIRAVSAVWRLGMMCGSGAI